MDDQSIQNPPLTEYGEEARQKNKPMCFSERLGIKDDEAGYKIKDLADKTGFIGMVLSLIIGFVIWSRVESLTGFLFGFLIAGIGIFASFVIISVLYTYGDMVTNSIEQTKILKRLEERKASGSTRPEQSTAQKNQEADAAADNQAASTSEAQTQPETSEADDLDETGEEEPKAVEKIKKIAKIPLHGVIDARMRRVAHFTERSRYGIICPVCGRKQKSERDNCYFCDCRFEYDDEPFQSDDDITLDRLRHLVDK